MSAQTTVKRPILVTYLDICGFIQALPNRFEEGEPLRLHHEKVVLNFTTNPTQISQNPTWWRA